MPRTQICCQCSLRSLICVRVPTLSLQEWETRQVGPEIGPTSAFSSCVRTVMYGPTCIFWANLTPSSLNGPGAEAGLGWGYRWGDLGKLRDLPQLFHFKNTPGKLRGHQLHSNAGKNLGLYKLYEKRDYHIRSLIIKQTSDIISNLKSFSVRYWSTIRFLLLSCVV